MADSSADTVPDGVEVLPAFSVRGGPGGIIHSPIHETVTLAALVSTGYTVAPGTTLDSASNDDWEYIRGVVWNDDPANLLFEQGERDKNHNYSNGATWLWWFKLGEKQWANNDPAKWKNAIGRSHYGDLQFLHCMASVLGELPTETKGKFMKWLEVLWKLANSEDGISPDTTVSDTALKEFLPLQALPANWTSFDYFLAGNTAYKNKDIRRRALGSIFHFIQDSYALGHTRRTLLNPQDRVSDSKSWEDNAKVMEALTHLPDPLKFRSGTVDRWGALENFHVYNGQNDSSHSLYDHASENIRDPGKLSNLDQFNDLIGCRDAVDKCIGLIKLKQAGKTWNTGVRDYLDNEVFPLSPNATPANTQVWP